MSGIANKAMACVVGANLLLTVKRKLKRDHIVKELLLTEKTYVNHLNNLIEVCISSLLVLPSFSSLSFFSVFSLSSLSHAGTHTSQLSYTCVRVWTCTHKNPKISLASLTVSLSFLSPSLCVCLSVCARASPFLPSFLWLFLIFP